MNTAHQEKLQQAREPSSIPLRRKEGSVRAPHGYLRLGRRLPDANPNGALQHYGHAGIRRKNGIAMPNNVRAAIHELITAPITPFKRQSPTLLLS
jgi:hypothetical protein